MVSTLFWDFVTESESKPLSMVAYFDRLTSPHIYPIDLVIVFILSILSPLSFVLLIQIFPFFPFLAYRTIMLSYSSSTLLTETLYRPQDTFWRHNQAIWDDSHSLPVCYPWSDCCFTSEISWSSVSKFTSVNLQGINHCSPHFSIPDKPKSLGCFIYSYNSAIRLKHWAFRHWHRSLTSHRCSLQTKKKMLVSQAKSQRNFCPAQIWKLSLTGCG